MSSNWQVYRTASPSLVLPAVANGSYEIEVVAIDAFGNRSAASVATQGVERSATGATGFGGTIEPVLEAAVVAMGPWVVQASWALALAGSLNVKIRHSPEASGATWGTSNPLISGVVVNSEGQVLLPALTGTYLFRHENDGGAVSITTAVMFRQPQTSSVALATINEATTGFTGSKVNCIFDADLGGLRLNPAYWDDLAVGGNFDGLPGLIDDYGAPKIEPNTWDDLATNGNFDAISGLIDDYGADGRKATYQFASGFDAGSTMDLELSRVIRSRSRLVAPTWDALLGTIDEILTIDGETADSGAVILEYQDSMDPLVSGLAASWSGWKPLTRSIVRARSLRFRALLSVTDLNQDVVVLSLAVAINQNP
jgi:hypothetical protein